MLDNECPDPSQSFPSNNGVEINENTEEIIKRLTNVNAEITIPDINNIFISEYFCECYSNGADIRTVIDGLLPDIQACVKSLSTYFSEYEISERRSGWWSELYKEKWNI